LAAIATFAMLFSFAAPAAELKAPLQTCTTADCGATVLVGRINKSDRCCGFANLGLPWVAQLYAGKNECLRIHVTAQAENTELVAVAPKSQRAWRNDTSGLAACPNCPLLKIRTLASEQGWFLIQVNQAAGAALDGEFTLTYARYAALNPNCSPATPALPAP
jgi:hypothetical protein